MSYQLEPLKKALQMPRVNLFVADDVGLGKTIEAGLILRELIMRQKVKRHDDGISPMRDLLNEAVVQTLRHGGQVAMLTAKELTRDAAREVLTTLTREGGDPREIVKLAGLGALRGADGGQLAV